MPHFPGFPAVAVRRIQIAARAGAILPVACRGAAIGLLVHKPTTNGLPARPRRAPVFTIAIVAAAAVSLAIILGFGVTPVDLLVVASIAGGIATPIGLIVLMLLARDRRTMAGRAIGGRLYAAGWGVTAVITILSVIYLVQQFVLGG